MRSYAVLGATGNTGRALVEVLLQSPEVQINVYCRSRTRFCSLVSSAAEDSRVRIFEGPLSDVSLMTDCLRGTRAAFLAVAVADNMPGCTVARDSARAVVAALREADAETPSPSEANKSPGVAESALPRLVVLSSASLEPRFSGDVPPFVHAILDTCVSHLYRDLAEAEGFLRRQRDWLSCVFVKPGGLVHDERRGHAISTTTAKTPLSYLDLAAGMVEIAESDVGQYDMKNVSVIPTADNVAFPWAGVYYAFTGLLYHFMPWSYRYLGDYRSSWNPSG